MSRGELLVDVIEGLAEADNMDPTELEYNLSEFIDPAVLRRLDDMEGGQWELKFRVSDHQVRISHRGAIFIDGTKYRENLICTAEPSSVQTRFKSVTQLPWRQCRREATDRLDF